MFLKIVLKVKKQVALYRQMLTFTLDHWWRVVTSKECMLQFTSADIQFTSFLNCTLFLMAQTGREQLAFRIWNMNFSIYLKSPFVFETIMDRSNGFGYQIRHCLFLLTHMLSVIYFAVFAEISKQKCVFICENQKNNLLYVLVLPIFIYLTLKR